uniref:ABC transporter domain-containing protein n=1 Tax=Timema cristinae TaxID=61476 RepID=A0A7R9CSX1_TIMCR|nr:unnamed protein product [Timema cristinae]
MSVDRVTKQTYEGKVCGSKGRKKILHEICGRFVPSQLIAIMGPSGAGKSTLLDILSGYRISGVTGVVGVDGVERDLDEFRRLSCYITQDDRLEPLLTVQENMRIEEILSTLGLLAAQKTRAAMLSGGQKKRLSIALELVNNPMVMFLDEPTTPGSLEACQGLTPTDVTSRCRGLDSSSCSQCLKLLKMLARQGRTIVCTIHQPSASLFQQFDHVYVLSQGRCLYQGSTDQLQEDNGTMKRNEESSREADEEEEVPQRKTTRSLQETSTWNQMKVLLYKGFLKSKRDTTLTHMRLGVNVMMGMMLGTLFFQSGNDGSRTLDNYNLLFSILVHQMSSNMMLSILTFPMEMTILMKEHFNRWYSLKSFYLSITIVDIPVSVISCVVFSLIVYIMTGQPMEPRRIVMFLVIGQLTMFVSQTIGLMIGSIFDVVNGTFLGPTLTVPIMMFAGFGINLRDMPVYLHWGTYISYLRFSLEGIIAAIYGDDRPVLDCPEHILYCHYKHPSKFLHEIAMNGDMFWIDLGALSTMVVLGRAAAYFLLRWKLYSVR